MQKALALAAILALFSASAIAACPPKATPPLLTKGKAAYTTNCQICHGEKGDGNGTVPMNPKPRNFITDDFKKGGKSPAVADVMESVAKGLPGTAMAPFGHLSEDDRCAITHYVLSFRKTK